MAFEKQLAASHLTPAQLLDPHLTYNPGAALPTGLDWDAYFHAAGAPPGAGKNIECPAALAASLQISPSALRAYLRWHVLKSYAAYLPLVFAEAHFGFFKRRLEGVSRLPARRDLVMDAANSHLGAEVGQLYADAYWNKERGSHVMRVAQAVRLALRARMSAVSWLTPATRAAALEKLDAMAIRVGRGASADLHHSASTGPSSSWAEAVLAARRAHHERAMTRAAAGTADPRVWLDINPQTVNACYNPQLNCITLPAAILQPPFFDESAPLSANLGALGAVVGHEFVHGYDGYGRQFDKLGALKDWWMPPDVAAFSEREARLAASIGAHMPGLDVKLTSGENTADAGGLRLALDALGPSPSQEDLRVFFCSWATLWRARCTSQDAARRLKEDPHPTPLLRVNWQLSNFPEFHAAWGVRPGDGMWRPPERRVAIW